MSELIYQVDTVTASRGKSNPPVLIVDAGGQVNTSGWTDAQLSPHVYIVPPEDGVQGFDFVAEKPDGGSLQVLSPIEAETFTAPLADWVRGVRVHAATNEQEAML